jgi:hypothetical protein
MLDEKDDRKIFPVKAHTAASTKVNVFFRHVWQDAKVHFPEAAAYLSRNPGLLKGLYNDQASAWVIWFCAVWQHDPSVAVSVLVKSRDQSWLKEFSTEVKSLGLTSGVLGRCVTELKGMVGRGAAPLDRDADVEGRISVDVFEARKSCGIGEEIRPYVRQVISEELGQNPSWGTTDEYWSRRWLYTKAGSHARRVEEQKLGGKLELPPQPTRREFVENVKENMVAYGKPLALAGQSGKLENGSERAIYSCDTINYCTFDYLLRPVEAVWRNANCLLDPGSRSQTELYGGLSTKKDVHVMLDFEDYNSQHTLDAMKVVIDEATRGAPEDVRTWALESISNSKIFWLSNDGQRKEAKCVGGLFSGHRATTFINTILNSAYIRYIYGELTLPFESYHAGDDMYANATEEQAERLIDRSLASSVRFNPSKQGLGTIVGEFLRVAFTKEEAGGYFARSVAAVTSGNWVSEVKLDPGEAATTYANQCWTMRIRSGVDLIGCCLLSSFRFRVPEIAQYAQEAVLNKVSVNGSPVVDCVGHNLVSISLTVKKNMRPDTKGKLAYATQDFVEKHIDKEVIALSGLTVKQIKRQMLEVSYKWRGDVEAETAPLDVAIVQVPARDFLPYTEIRPRNVRTETRSESFMAKLLSRLQPGWDWEKLVRIVLGGSGVLGYMVDKYSWPITNNGTLGVSELGRLGRKVLHPVCTNTNYPIRV